MSDILDSIFEGYSYDGELKVINEKAARKAASSLHKLVLEKSRDLWDQLEAAEGSLADVAEEISFEELNTDPSSMDTSTGSSPAPAEAPAPADASLSMEEPTLESILGADSDIDFDSIFEMRPGHMMDAEGDPSEMVDGDQDYEDLEMGMDDAAMGSPDMEGDQLDGGQQGDQFGDQQMDDMGGQQGDQMGDQFGDQQMDDEFGMGGQQGDQFGGQQGDQMGDQMGGQQMDGEIDLDSEGGFDFDLDLEGDDAEMDEGFGKAYRMESKGDKDDDDKDEDKDKDDDDDKDDDKKKGKKDLPWEKDDKDD